MSVNEFMGQRLDWFFRVRNAEEVEQVYFIDEVG